MAGIPKDVKEVALATAIAFIAIEHAADGRTKVLNGDELNLSE